MKVKLDPLVSWYSFVPPNRDKCYKGNNLPYVVQLSLVGHKSSNIGTYKSVQGHSYWADIVDHS
jgi:hypothetical protein